MGGGIGPTAFMAAEMIAVVLFGVPAERPSNHPH
jgi:hypothetical protein